MLVQDVMTPTVDTVTVDTTVRNAARLMESHDIGFLPVLHEGVAAGIVTDRDITLRVVAHGLDPETTRVGEIMSTGVPHHGERRLDRNSGIEMVFVEDDLDQAFHRMEEAQVRRVLVRDSNDQIVGVLSMADIARHLNA